MKSREPIVPLTRQQAELGQFLLSNVQAAQSKAGEAQQHLQTFLNTACPDPEAYLFDYDRLSFILKSEDLEAEAAHG